VPGRAVDRALPITYRKYGAGRVIVDGTLSVEHVFEVIQDFVSIEGLEIQNSSKDGIRINSDSCVVTGCYIYDVNDFGISTDSDGILFERNVIAHTGKDAFEIDGEFCNTYHNTVL